MIETAAAAPRSFPATAITVEDVAFRYNGRTALDGVSFEVARAEIFGILGPNGGGKTTLFRILSTAAVQARGSVTIFGNHLPAARDPVRELLGVVFQSPSVDGKLTVAENLRYHGHLYGLHGAALRSKIDHALDRLGVADRAHERVESLSGGLRRRVELAKGLLTDPRLLILDEPSTGLDPGARIDLWRYLRLLRETDGTTILLTTHLMDEAEQCDRIAILDCGRMISIGSPDSLRQRIGGDVVTIRSPDPGALARRLEQRFGQVPTLLGDTLRLERPDGHLFVRQLVEAFPEEIVGVSLSKPTLEDVFVHETGHRFWGDS